MGFIYFVGWFELRWIDMRKLLFLLFWLQCFASLAQVIENPIFDRTDQPEFHIDKIESVNDTTFFYCSLFIDHTWANFSPDAYVEDYITKNKYKVLKIDGLPHAPEKKVFYSSETINVKLSFPYCHNLTKCNLIENSNGKAFNIFGVSLKQHSEKKYQKSDLNRFLNMSSFYDLASDTTKAISYKREEIEASKYYYGMTSEAVLCSSLGLCLLYEKYGCHEETMKLIKHISNLQDSSLEDNSLEYIILNRTFATYYSILYDYENAINTFKEAITLYDKLGIVDNVYALLLRYVANDYCASGDENNFLFTQKRCIEVRRKLGDGRSYLEDLLLLLMRNAKPNSYVGRIQAVESELEKLPVFVDSQSLDYVYFLEKLTLMYGLINNNKIAIEICKKRLSILEGYNNKNSIKIAEALGEECKYFKRLENYHEAIKTGKNAIELFDSLQVKPEMYKTTLENLASLYINQFDYETSISLMNLIISINEQEEDWLALTESLYTTGNYFLDKENVDKAENYILKALDVINEHDRAEEYLEKQIELHPESIGDSNYYIANYNDMILSIKGSIYASLGFVSSNKGNYDEAILYEHKAGEYMKTQLNNYDGMEPNLLAGYELYAKHLQTLSRYYSRNKQFEKSNDCAWESIDYCKKCGSSDYYYSYMLQAINMCMINENDSAIYYAKEALSVSDLSNNIEGKNKSLCLLADIYCIKEDYPKAEENMSIALDNYQNTIKKEIVHMKNEQKQRFWYYLEPLFLKYRDIIIKSNWNRNLFSKLYNYILFSKCLLLDTDNTNDEKTYIKMNINWRDIQTVLSNKDIAIEFITTQEDSINRTYHALIIDNNCEYPNMITLFNDFEFELERIKWKDIKTDLEILGDLIWKPILNQYINVENIFFSPDGMLHIKPIEYCKIGGIGGIMEHYNLYRLSSTKEIFFLNNKHPKNNAILYGGLDYNMLAKESINNKDEIQFSLIRSINARGGFDPLLSTFEEINEIGNLLNSEKVSTTLYTGADGTEESFKDLSGMNVNMLHLSTHGMYVGPSIVEQKKKEDNFAFLELITNDKDPVKEDIVLTHSFLVMSGGNRLSRRETLGPDKNDGILTALEISHTDLSKVDLVVLSACETGLGDLDNGGVYGLQRGFKKAGANAILMSLDKVDDEATKILMVEFYRNLMSGKTKNQSLKDAQKHLRHVDNGKYDKPEYWASFIMLDGIN